MQNIVFSKNRPLQLDLTLKSIEKNWGGDIDIVYTTSKEYIDSYKILAKQYPDYEFVKQGKNIFRDVYESIDSSPDDYICFFTDDDIVYRDAGRYLSCEALDSALSDTACLSLRLGTNISKRDISGTLVDDSIPQLFPCSPSLIKWNRTSIPIGGYWSYPLSVDGHVFKSSVIKNIMSEMSSWVDHCRRDLTFRYDGTPNMLESMMQRFWFELPAIMAAPLFSCVVNSPNNRVQSSVKNRSGDLFPIDPKDALKLFEEGKRINLNSLISSEPNIKCPHQEIDLLGFTEKI